MMKFMDDPITLLVETFTGRNFRDFANFLVVRKSLYLRNRTFEFIREKSMKRKNKIWEKWHEIKKMQLKFPSFAKVYTRET